MDPLVLLFLSKTEKVEEYLDNNSFSNSLTELDNLDELNHNLDLFDSKTSNHLDFMSTNNSSTNSNNHHHLNHHHTNSIEDDHHQLLDEESTGVEESEHSSFSGYTNRLGDNSSPEVSSTQNALSVVNHYSPYDIGLSKENNDLLSNSRPICKEEMSPSSMDCSMDQKKKKGPMPRQQEELCLVCGDRASGYHYNALTCEGCKGFFRRSITKNAVYQCKYGNNCEIDMYMRRKCQECRLKKCLRTGMRPECVVPEYQCAIKRENKRQQKELNKPNSTTKELNNNLSASQDNSMCINRIPKLSPQQLETIQKLVFFQEEYESPGEEEVNKITPFTLGDTEEDGLRRFKHMTEMTILTVQLIVEFSKKVPGFDTLLREDQITLLKACSSEVMMLRCSRKYDLQTDSILYANNQPYTRENYKSASVDQSADQLFNFCRNMCILKVDNAEYALITAIVIFSERPNLQEPKKVEKIQDYYVNILKTYVENKRQPGKCYFAKLLAILTELRTLGNINSEMCVSLKVKNKKLPQFLVEIWDLN